MNRCPSGGFAEAIAEALRVARRFLPLVGHTHFFCGTDPVFAGLHAYRQTEDGRSYADTAHCVYPHHVLGPADRRATTVVLPAVVHPHEIVHELGHVLHERIGFHHSPKPVTSYAATNSREAFAEAFTAWHYAYGDEAILWGDLPTVALFRSLEAAG